MIRTEHIAEIRWPNNPLGCPADPEGPCILVFWDGRVKQCYVPFNDTRIWYALSSHNVGTGTVSIQTRNYMETSEINKFANTEHIRTFAPILGIGLIFGITRWVANQKGDV